MDFTFSHLVLPPSVEADLVRMSQWELLYQLVQANPLGSVTLVRDGNQYILREIVSEEYEFCMYRYLDGSRETIQDPLGVIGLSLVNPKNPTVRLTEGVSDYISAKLAYPDKNILGFTTLGGNKVAKTIVGSLFENFVIFADNDSGKEINTGVANSLKMKSWFESLGKRVRIELPVSGNKDLTQQFISDLRFSRMSMQ